jgi:KipI family sensor histidine kinase inhibitor
MRIEPLGDAAWLIRIAEEFDPATSLDAVLRGVRQLEAAAIPGIVDLAPSYTTIGVFLDHRQIDDLEKLREQIQEALRNSGAPASSQPTRELEVPVCYEDNFALDLDEVARNASLPADEVVRRHSAAIYRVSCVGFTPGFPYLSGLPPELATPRRASPRKEIPAGSVAIGGAQAGIYPRKSPGGWNIIGRTPLRLFDVGRDPAALFSTGDRILFRKISRDEFERLSR